MAEKLSVVGEKTKEYIISSEVNNENVDWEKIHSELMDDVSCGILTQDEANAICEIILEKIETK